MTDAQQSEPTRERAPLLPRFDVAFPLAGGPVPLDHGYALFSALSRALGEGLHGAPWLAVHPLTGLPLANRSLALRPGRPALRLRVDAEHIGRCVELAGGTLHLGGAELLVGTSRVFALRPAPALAARMVTIKGFLEPEPFREALRRQLGALDVTARIEIGKRRALRVAGDTIVGFQVTLHDLDEPGALVLQYSGLGGRQRMGCGVFTPPGRGSP